MIYRNGKPISSISYGGKVIATVYHGAVLVWQAVRSCFGSGRWIRKKPWLGKERWKHGEV